MLQLLLWLWASPWSLVGMTLGGFGLLRGGKVQRIGRVLEFHGGFVRWFLRSFPLVKNASAVTFGHTILGLDADVLKEVREHEFVHVRQYERWGPLFVPAYLFCWCVLWWRGKHPYFDNPFEVEAYTKAPAVGTRIPR
jgi:hypothetical protein